MSNKVSPIFNLIPEKSTIKPEDIDKSNKNNEKEQEIIVFNNTKRFNYKEPELTNDIIKEKTDEVISIIDKNLVLLEEDYIKEIIKPSIFNNCSSLMDVEKLISLISFNCSFVSYILSQKLNLGSVEDNDFIILIVQYTKVVLQDIIRNSFSIDDFYIKIRNLYNIYSHDILGNPIPTQKSIVLTEEDFNLDSPILERDVRMMVSDYIKDIVEEQIENYKEQVKGIADTLISAKDEIIETAKKQNKK